MRLRIGASFGVVLAGLVGLGLVVSQGLRPIAHQAGEIARYYGRGVDALARLRGAITAIRDTAGRSRPLGPQALKRLEAARLGARETSRQYAEIPAPAEEVAIRHELAYELDHLDALAASLLEPAPAAEIEPRLGALRDAATRADGLAERLLRMNSELAAAASTRVDEALRRMGWTTLLLAVSAGLAAVLLLLVAFHAVERHAAATDTRAAEMEAFAGRVAHDLRTPLQTIRLSVELIAREVKDPQVLRVCERAQRNTVRLGRFIDDLLAFSRAGAHPEPGAEADVGEVLEGIRDEIGPRAAEAKASLSLSAEPGLAVAMAPGAFRAVAANLVENALKYLGEAADRRVEVAARLEGEEVALAVRDTGPGIPAGALPHLFDLHFRAAPHTPGFGVGLATVKRLVDAHGGRVEVESVPGRGTAFTVRLPRSAVRGARTARAAS